jgi:RNA polymerase sigma factor (sigma-70 family)
MHRKRSEHEAGCSQPEEGDRMSLNQMESIGNSSCCEAPGQTVVHLPQDREARRRLYLQLNSSDLVARWRQGDQQAAAELHRRYVQKVTTLVDYHLSSKLAARFSADDVAQSVFGSLFRMTREKSHEFDSDEGFWKWLLTLTLNKTFKRIERERRAKRSPDREVRSPAEMEFDEVLAGVLRSHPSPDQIAEIADLVNTVLDRISPDHQQILLLWLQEHTQPEIARQLGVDERTVRRKLRTIRRLMAAVAGMDECEAE